MSPAAQSNHHQRAKKAVKDFIEHDFNPDHEIKQQCGQMEVRTDGIDWNRVRKGELLYIFSKFDEVEWWREVGWMKHLLIYPMAPALIAIPSPNGILERIFSSCTWFNDSLRWSLKPKRFEMAILESINKVILDESDDAPTNEKVKEIVAKVIDIFEDDIDFDAAIDLSLYTNAENFIVDDV